MNSVEQALLSYLRNSVLETEANKNEVTLRFDYHHEAHQFNELLKSYIAKSEEK